MQDAKQQLDIIYTMMAAFASSADITRSLQEGLEFIRAEIGAEAASFFYLTPETQTLRCVACIGPTDITGMELPADQGIIGAVTQSDDMRFVADTLTDPDFDNSVDRETGFVTKSMICVPVSGRGKRFGAIQLINRMADDGIFSPGDAALVSVLGKAAALAIINSEMAASMVEADGLKRDLAMASRVQESLFPQEDFDFIHGVNIPKKGVSGDLFDYVHRDGQIYFCMADVSGKGTEAALVMAKTHSVFRSLSRPCPSPAELAVAINRELVETATNGMFVTAIIGTYTPESGRMMCCNAGHEPGLIIAPHGELRYIEASTQPLGILEMALSELETQEADLSNARFFCYSDGITEAEINGTMLGNTRLANILAEQMDISLRVQIENTVTVVRSKAAILPDDLTLLGLGHGAGTRGTRPIPTTQVETIEGATDADEDLLFDITLLNEVSELRRVRRALDDQFTDTLLAPRLDDIKLVVDEALQNIIQHAFPEDSAGRIQLRGHIAAHVLHIAITDTAPLIDLGDISPRALSDVREGGLGTHFITSATDKAGWSHDGGQNRLDLEFNLPPNE